MTEKQILKELTKISKALYKCDKNTRVKVEAVHVRDKHVGFSNVTWTVTINIEEGEAK